MDLIGLCLVFLVMGLCIAEGKTERRRFLSGVLSLLCLPVAILLAVTKKNS